MICIMADSKSHSQYSKERAQIPPVSIWTAFGISQPPMPFSDQNILRRVNSLKRVQRHWAINKDRPARRPRLRGAHVAERVKFSHTHIFKPPRARPINTERNEWTSRARESDSTGGAILINWFATAEPTRKEIITQIVPRAGFKKRRRQTEAK